MKTFDEEKRLFYISYNGSEWFGVHTTNNSLQKQIEKFRNRMAVEFFNLTDEDDIKAFGAKYKYDYTQDEKRFNEKLYKLLESQDNSDLFITTLHKEFKGIVSKVLDKQDLSDAEIDTINEVLIDNKIIPIRIKEDEGKTTQMLFPVPKGSWWALARALFEWVVLLSLGEVKLFRCKVCKKPVIPTPRGRNQMFCSPRCKTRFYRQSKKQESKS